MSTKMFSNKLGLALTALHLCVAMLTLQERQIFGGFFYDLFNVINIEIALLAWGMPDQLYLLFFIYGSAKWYFIGWVLSLPFGKVQKVPSVKPNDTMMCQKCSRTYDSSWSVCLYCSTKLTAI